MTNRVRRRGLLLGHVNAALWSMGTSLTSGGLISYFALDLGATGVSLGLIFALPSLVGLLRLVAPLVIERVGSTKRACVALSSASYVILLMLPVIAILGRTRPRTGLMMMIVILCAHQLLEYIGSVAFWSWLGELVPRRVRGRYFARRQIVQLIVAIPTLLAGGALADYWRKVLPDEKLWGYAILNALGACALVVSLVPLATMPDGSAPVRNDGVSWSAVWAPFHDRRFGRLVMFGCWLAAANGMTGAAQDAYPFHALALPILTLQWMRITMRAGQMGVAQWAGAVSDRFGNRPMMVLCQTVVASSMCFFLAASPQQPMWLFGAYVAWAFYAGLNIGLPNLMLRLAPAGQERDNSGFIALYFATSGVCYALSSVAGGRLFDLLAQQREFWVGPYLFSHYQVMFALGLVARGLAVVWLFLLIEPGAASLRETLQLSRRVQSVKTIE